MKTEINSEFAEALELMEDSAKLLFITGRAGTGKSTLLQYFRKNTKKNMIVLAPTGVAALNVQGQTIHSFFGFPPQITPEQACKEHPFDQLKSTITKLDLIIIDEASMLRADLLDTIDQTLRQYGNKDKPFGGIRIVLIGDLYQLPPVLTSYEKNEFLQQYASPYFFDAKVFQQSEYAIIELEKIYRQKDHDFIELLNAIRCNQVGEQHMSKLNQQLKKQKAAHKKANEITLCPTNIAVNNINQTQLNELSGDNINLNGKTAGDFQRQLPTDLKLQLKIGAQIMLVNNDAAKRWANGSMGTILDYRWCNNKECHILDIKLSNGINVEVPPYTWETNNYYYEPETESIEAECLGSFTQYPVRLAWAVTIHKSQGKTFDQIVIDIGQGAFAHGQVYVALSRCTSLQGLILRKPILKHHIKSDPRIQSFLNGQALGQPYKSLTLPEKIDIIQSSIDSEDFVEINYEAATGNMIKRKIRPLWIGELEYEGREYLALEVEPGNPGEQRVFSVDRIIDITAIPLLT